MVYRKKKCKLLQPIQIDGHYKSVLVDHNNFIRIGTITDLMKTDSFTLTSSEKDKDYEHLLNFG